MAIDFNPIITKPKPIASYSIEILAWVNKHFRDGKGRNNDPEVVWEYKAEKLAVVAAVRLSSGCEI